MLILNYKRGNLKKDVMEGVSYVIVFPTVFSKKRVHQLIQNIKKILKLKKQKYKSVKRDGDIILINANDPVFSSSAINLLFGIEKIAIARQIKNDFKIIVSEITLIGGNLLLKGEKFFVKVEGTSKGFFTKDIEIAATSSIIEKKSMLGAQPGTEENYDKLLYTFLTKKNAYVCIFSDDGQSGIPYNSKSENSICCIYDEISAITCFETIKQGFNPKIIVCYRKKSELMNLAKMINQIIPRLVKDEVELTFFQFKLKQNKNYLAFVNAVIKIILHEIKYDKINYLCLALSPLIFSTDFIDNSLKIVIQQNKLPIMPLSGIDNNIFKIAKEIGLERNIPKMKKLISSNSSQFTSFPQRDLQNAINSKKIIKVKSGPNNLHDILDSV